MGNRRIYVLNQRQEETYDAAGKAMRDVFTVLRKEGAKVIRSMPKGCPKLLKALDLPYLLVFLLVFAGKRDIIFYSIPESLIRIKLVEKIKRIKKYRILCFINDLNAFRYGDFSGEETRRELDAICAADDVLVPNQSTKEMLQKAGVSVRLIPVGIWDYLMNGEQAQAVRTRKGQAQAVRQKKEQTQMTNGKIRIAFAGNLNKSEFLSVMDIPDGVSMELWGKLDEEKQKKLPAGCHYHGMLSSEEIPLAICTMDYGLVWDGVGKDEIEGGLGEYLRYNNSHKCALYLAAGIPVIVWSQSGMARFVREHGCGITLDKLSDLQSGTAAADYETLKAQAEKVMPRLQQGFYLKKAMADVLKNSFQEQQQVL